MSGAVRGKIECVINAANRSNDAQVYFKNLYDFFTSHPQYTLIALQYGALSPAVPSGIGSGLGTNYYDVSGSFGFNAWFVVRQNATLTRPFDVYHLVQWSGGSNLIVNSGFGTAGSVGAPGQINGQGAGASYPNSACSCIGIQSVIGVGGIGGTTGSSGNGNPWKGGMNALTGVLGIDTKAQTGPIWGAPPGGGTGVIIFPRSNDGPNGAFRTLAQNCAAISYFDLDAMQQRMGIVGDDDSFVIFNDHSDNGNYSIVYCGLYLSRSNAPASANPYPYMMLSMGNANLPLTFTDQSVYGDVAGTAAAQGGIAGTITASCASLQLDHFVNNFLGDINFWPDRQMFAGGNAYNEFPIWVGIFEQVPIQQSGWLGQLTFLKEMYNVPTNDTKSDFNRIFLGTTTVAQSKISAPWDNQNNTVPRSGASRAGVTFVSTASVAV